MMVIFLILVIIVICVFSYAILLEPKQRDKHQDRLLREEWLKRHRREGVK
uniref:Uncharacterized protein n=1 Tax=viral metagenome TaxID=1070528 RepID=A0A6M3IW24_9ZZZZ